MPLDCYASFLDALNLLLTKMGGMLQRSLGDSFVVRTDKCGGEWFFTYIVVDGHEYLMMSGPHRSGLTHSPKCPCLNKNQTNNIPQIAPM